MQRGRARESGGVLKFLDARELASGSWWQAHTCLRASAFAGSAEAKRWQRAEERLAVDAVVLFIIHFFFF